MVVPTETPALASKPCLNLVEGAALAQNTELAFAEGNWPAGIKAMRRVATFYRPFDATTAAEFNGAAMALSQNKLSASAALNTRAVERAMTDNDNYAC